MVRVFRRDAYVSTVTVHAHDEGGVRCSLFECRRKLIISSLASSISTKNIKLRDGRRARSRHVLRGIALTGSPLTRCVKRIETGDVSDALVVAGHVCTSDKNHRVYA